jgi:hypothetical protein
MAEGFTSHPGKPEVQIPAVQIPVNHFLHIRPEKAVWLLITMFPDHFQVFEMGLYALKIMGFSRMARFVNIKRFSGRARIKYLGSPE